MRPAINRRLAVLCGALTASAALAQEAGDTPAIEPHLAPWTIRFEPFVGYISPAGDLRLPSGSVRGGEMDLKDLNLDSPRVVAKGQLRARRGPWTLTLGGMGFSADDRGALQETSGRIGSVAYSPGDRLVSDLSYETFEIQAAYRVLSHTSDSFSDGRTRLDAGLDIIGGLRYHHASIDVRNSPLVAPAPGTPLSTDADEFFAEPIIGARLDLVLAEDFGIEVESTAGWFGFGGRSSSSFSIDAGFAYRPTPSLGVKVGYRLQAFGLGDGSGAEEFEWRGSMAGLYGGLQFSF